MNLPGMTIVELLTLEAKIENEEPERTVMLLAVKKELENRGRVGQ